tara:strand:- start:1389 stop:2828 length:1440 start_codon:yes stop_codon:yes gene_type:complete
MFSGAATFNGDISSWDVSAVTDMAGMFKDATVFNGDISSWNVSAVTYITTMFFRAYAFNGDLSGWNTSSVTNMSYMFYRASAFNGDIGALWNFSNVTNFSYMIMGCGFTTEQYSNFLISLSTNNTLQIDKSLNNTGFVRLNNEETNTAYTLLTESVANGGKNMTIYDGGSYTAAELINYAPTQSHMIELNQLNQTYSITNDPYPVYITDSGGIQDSYSANENYSLLLTASSPITLSGTVDMERDYDYVKIYNGVDANATLLYTSSDTILENISVTSTNSSNQLFITITSDTGLNQSGLFLMATTNTPPSPSPDPICFPKGTLVLTNLGPIAIEKLNPDKHTIRGKEIVAITQSQPLQKHIVCFEKDALSKNVPSQQTLCSMEHKIFYKGEMVKARNLVDLCENVTFIPYNGETLFNVLLKKHDKMMINNLICETLHPENIAAKISTMKDGHKKNKAIQELTKIIKENNVPEYQKLYASL